MCIRDRDRPNRRNAGYGCEPARLALRVSTVSPPVRAARIQATFSGRSESCTDTAATTVRAGPSSALSSSWYFGSYSARSASGPLLQALSTTSTAGTRCSGTSLSSGL